MFTEIITNKIFIFIALALILVASFISWGSAGGIETLLADAGLAQSASPSSDGGFVSSLHSASREG
ncbi:hypothetical protein [Leucobacter salsicius]|uniref:hypothetical protein n=1 Tax=Leucobacter salsicius TaxID=664638 RepID=UPI0003499327|nr:hypothetical protein [Leucobacter salsicius]